MKRMALLGALLALTATVLMTGCPATPTGTGGGSGVPNTTKAPEFTLAWSEYPSWSVFGVASEEGLINGDKGKMGPLEVKHNVDVVLKQADYDPCITGFASGNFDAVCITNMDALNPALGRKSVAVLPTSTSAGADACIVDGEKVKDVKDLQNNPTFGLEKSVSQYAFIRCLEEMGEDPKAYKFNNMDPAAAATALQSGKEQKSIMVWNPYKLETLRQNKKTKNLFDTSKIPEEIIDMVVIGQDSLDKPGGDRFVQCVIDAYYDFNKMLNDPKKSDKLLVALGDKFSHLKLDDMKTATKETRFYGTPEKGAELYDGKKFQDRMGKIVDFCVKNEIVDKGKNPKVTFSATKDDSNLRFDSSFIKKAGEKK